MNRFDGKTILITGAGSGIGAACVRRLLSEGASVVAGDVRKEDVDRVVSEFAGNGRVYGVGIDVTNRDDVSAFVSGALQRFGSLFGLVNSAGIRGVGTVLDTEPEAWRRTVSVNLDGTFNVCQAFARAVKEAGTPGAIVNVTSGAGLMGVPNRLSYVASKFGVSGISRTMAVELAPFGIRVNAVAPGHDSYADDGTHVPGCGEYEEDPRRAPNRSMRASPRRLQQRLRSCYPTTQAL